MARRRFEIVIETDGMDYRKDGNEVALALTKAIPDIVRPFYNVTGKIEVKTLDWGKDDGDADKRTS